jgi:exonuclease III
MEKVLKITCWNVNGLFNRTQDYSKLEDPLFVDTLRESSIVGLVETHAGPDDQISLPGYKTVSITRPKSKLARKHSGGIAVLINDRLSKGITLNIKKTDYSVWIKLNKNFFRMEKDVYLGVMFKT